MQRYLNLTIGKLMFIKVQILVVEKYKKNGCSSNKNCKENSVQTIIVLVYIHGQILKILQLFYATKE